MLHNRKDYQERIVDKAGLIPDQEPVFLLRSQDPLAAETVHFYIKRAKQQLHADKPDIKPDERAKRQKAIDLLVVHAYAMADWQPKKTADVP